MATNTPKLDTEPRITRGDGFYASLLDFLRTVSRAVNPLLDKLARVTTDNTATYSNLIVNGDSGAAFLTLNKSGYESGVDGRLNNVLRWRILMGDSSAESGGNAGSNFQIQRYSDAGAYINTPLSIGRGDGVIRVNNTFSVESGAVPYVAPTIGWQVAGFSTAGSTYTCQNLWSNPNWFGVALQSTHVSGSWAGMQMVGGSQRIEFVLSGGAAFGEIRASAFTVTSDKTLKEEVGTVDDPLSLLTGARAYRYRWKDFEVNDMNPESPIMLGSYAQDWQGPIPEAITTDANGKLSLNYDPITAVTAAAVDQLHGIVKDQALLIAALESKINALTNGA